MFSFIIMSTLSGCLDEDTSIRASNWTDNPREILISINDTDQEFLNETYRLEPVSKASEEHDSQVLFVDLRNELDLTAGLYTLTASSGNFTDSVEFGMDYFDIAFKVIWIDVYPDRIRVSLVE